MFFFSYLVRTNPADVARVESKTVICTESKRESIPIPRDGVVGTVGHWAHPDDMKAKLSNLFDGCMKGMAAQFYKQVVIADVSISASTNKCLILFNTFSYT